MPTVQLESRVRPLLGRSPDGSDPLSRGRRRGAHLILVGLPGAGKSTVGRLVADRLQAPFIDLDVFIEQRVGKSVRAIFEVEGEDRFRVMEREATEIVAGLENLVLAPGGGWVTQTSLLALLRPPGRIIHLDVTPETAVARMGSDIASRPLLAKPNPVAAVAKLREVRRGAYASADAALNTESLELQQLVEQIATLAVAWDVGVG